MFCHLPHGDDNDYYSSDDCDGDDDEDGDISDSECNVIDGECEEEDGEGEDDDNIVLVKVTTLMVNVKKKMMMVRMMTIQCSNFVHTVN